MPIQVEARRDLVKAMSTATFDETVEAAFLLGIDPRQASRGHLDCRGCMRYLKDQLKARSWAFRWMNDRIDPVFNRLRDTMVSEDEIEEARVFARQAAGP